MSDEEKQATEWLKRLVKINKRDNLDNTFAEILLNLIEKQSKEIEELKEVKWYYEISRIPKDKIKAKIEPRLKELDEQMKKEWKEYGNSREYQDMEDEWNFLQSLLEKE